MSEPEREIVKVPGAWQLAERIVQGRLIDACGWWFLRQKSTRGELVKLGVVSRARSYAHEKRTAELFGKPVDDLTEADIRRWLRQELPAD